MKTMNTPRQLDELTPTDTEIANVERTIKNRLARITRAHLSSDIDSWIVSDEAQRLARAYRELDLARAMAAQGASV